MNISRQDLNLFIVFDVVYREENLTRAGEVLCISQPAVSNALARLRGLFNDPLFVRSGQKMLPTPMAKNIIGPVRKALHLLNEALQESEVFDPSVSERKYRVSMLDLAEALLLPDIFTALKSRSPGADLSSYRVERKEIAKELSSGRLDFAIDVPLLSDPELNSHQIYVDEYVCMVRKGHPEVQGSLSLQQYMNLEHVHVSSRRRGKGHVDLALKKLGLQRRISLRSQHYLFVENIIKDSDLAISLPLGLANEYDFQVLELPFNVPPVEFYIFWHKSSEHDPANRWLRQLIFDSLAHEYSFLP